MARPRGKASDTKKFWNVLLKVPENLFATIKSEAEQLEIPPAHYIRIILIEHFKGKKERGEE